MTSPIKVSLLQRFVKSSSIASFVIPVDCETQIL